MRDLRGFSGRGTDQAVTEFINRRILNELEVQPEDRLVDIGCGDGTLLRFGLQSGLTHVVGLAGSEEEAALLRTAGLDVKQAHSDSLPLPDRSASVVVCNSVLHIVPAEQIPARLRELQSLRRESG